MSFRKTLLFCTALIVPGLACSATAQHRSVVGNYTYSGPGTVNTYWVETPGGGLVVIDVQRDLTHAREALAAVQKTGKPVRAVLITHGHPDHYAGIGIFKQAYPNAIVWSSRITSDTIKNDPYGFNALMHKAAPQDSPVDFILPDRIFSDNQTLDIDGLKIVTREFGKAEANSATVYYLPESCDLFVGDLVLTHLHALFGEEDTTDWLAALDRVSLIYPQALILHPGHGASGPKDALLAEERQYIVTTRRMAMDEFSRSGASPSSEARVVSAIKSRYPYENPAGLRPIVPISVHGMFDEFSKPSLLPVTKEKN